MLIAIIASKVLQLINCWNITEFREDKPASLIFENKNFILHQPPKISIVILNWNGKKFLEQFLPSVLASEYSNKEIVVADNGSSDDSVAFLESIYPTIRIIKFNQNYGFAKGYNEALKQVQSDYYFILNSG